MPFALLLSSLPSIQEGGKEAQHRPSLPWIPVSISQEVDAGTLSRCCSDGLSHNNKTVCRWDPTLNHSWQQRASVPEIWSIIVTLLLNTGMLISSQHWAPTSENIRHKTISGGETKDEFLDGNRLRAYTILIHLLNYFLKIGKIISRTYSKEKPTLKVINSRT